jgi:hypothetical protein
LNPWACPFSQKDVGKQQDWQSQANGEMNPTGPRTQSFVARVIKAIARDGQNTERAQKYGSICSIPTGAPGESHMPAQEHTDQHQNCHGGSAMDFHRPCF